MTKFARRYLVTTILAASVTNPALARGLKQLQPAQAGKTSENPNPPGAVTNPEGVIEEKPTQSPTEVKAETEVKKPVSQDRIFIGTSIAWANLSADKGGWHTGFTSDIIAGYRVASLMQKRLLVYSTLRYLPFDVLVKHEGQQYRGIVENYLVGGMATYKYRSLNYLAGIELGATGTRLSSIDPYPMDTSLEKSGVNFTISSGLGWSPWPGVQVGGQIYLGAGTFTSIQTAANVNFSL